MKPNRKSKLATIKYICMGGPCHRAVFYEPKQMEPLICFEMTVKDVPWSSEPGVGFYFNTGDFHHGAIVCMPAILKEQWINEGKL